MQLLILLIESAFLFHSTLYYLNLDYNLETFLHFEYLFTINLSAYCNFIFEICENLVLRNHTEWFYIKSSFCVYKMPRLNIVPDMTHDFLLTLSRGEGLSQVRYFSGDFFIFSFVFFRGFLHCFSCWCCFSSGFSRSYQLRLCSVQTAPLAILENCFEKKNIIFGWFSEPVSTQYEIR